MHYRHISVTHGQPLIIVSLLLLLAVAWVIHPGAAAAGTPMDALQATGQKVRLLLNDPELKQPEHRIERRNQLMSIIEERFSCEEMSKRSLGDQWGQLTSAEQHEFTRLFSTLLAKSYMSKIEGYAGEPIRYLGERLTNGYAVVRAQVLSPKNEFQLDFRMVEKAGEWLIYDVVVDGISLMNSYRGQFSRVLTFASIEGLLKRMREKADLPVHARAD